MSSKGIIQLLTLCSASEDQNALKVTLDGSIEEKTPFVLSHSDVRNLAFQIACGLEHLESMEV